MKKLISLFLLIMSFTITTFGCSASKNIPAEQTAQALYKLYVHSDGEDSKEVLGFTDEDINTVLDQLKTSYITSMKLSFTNSGLTITDEEAEKLFNLRIDALKKLTPTISVESEGEEEVTIKLSTNFINLDEIDKTAGNNAVSESNETGQTSKEELSKLYIENSFELLSSAEPSTETVEETFVFKKQATIINNKYVTIWIPKDILTFSIKITTMSSGAES